MKQQYIADDLKARFSREDLFRQVDALEGEIYRKVASRRTIRTIIDGEPYFAKIHFGVGWGEIIKNLLQGRLPVLGAGNEYAAIRRLENAGVPTMEVAVYCEEGRNPAARHSAIVTRSIEAADSLEHFQPESVAFKRLLINEIADISRKMHGAGVNHRDFYLCHFLMRHDRQTPLLRVIDLHRAQIRQSVPRRWLVKDLGGLLFSAFDKALTKRDLLRFIRRYTGQPLRQSLQRDARFWDAVRRRAIKLYLQDHPALPDDVERLLH